MLLVGVGHASPQLPQWAVDVTRFVSQPSVAMPLQSPYPARHEYPHTPAKHIAVALGGIVHEVPHAPQLFTSVGSARQLPLHAVIPVGHTVMHTPAMHAIPLAQASPHVPQWVLVSSAASQPLLATPSQSPKPVRHVYPHAPTAHVAVVFAGVGHTLPHVPQWFTSAIVEAHSGTPPIAHNTCPDGQPQVPPTHDSVAGHA